MQEKIEEEEKYLEHLQELEAKQKQIILELRKQAIEEHVQVRDF